MEQANHTHFRLDVLDGLRGFAIFQVAWLHLWELSWLSSNFEIFGVTIPLDVLPVTGALGVELFLFISGFCLFHSYVKTLDQGSQIQKISDYAYRRMIKILPSYLLAMLIILVCFEHPFTSVKDYLFQIFTHLFFIHNWFPESYGAINGVFWSLGVEIQFYLIFPLVCSLFLRKPVLVFLSFFCASMAYRYAVHSLYPDQITYLVNQLPGFLDCFLGGMLSAHLVRRLSKSRVREGWMTFIALIAAVAFFVLIKNGYDTRYEQSKDVWRVYYRAPLVLIFIIFTVSSCFAVKVWKSTLANPAAVFLSTISYNLYIWHQFIAQRMFQNRIPSAVSQDPHQDPQWQMIFMGITAVLGVLMATLLTYGFERPLLRLKSRNSV